MNIQYHTSPIQFVPEAPQSLVREAIRPALYLVEALRNPVSIPVTPTLGRLMDETPAIQEYLVVSLEGRKLTPERASGIV
ncbi:hypothetical protein ACN2XU_14315 [Primorskyibacter sp. 2E107]|uniref:hypothetical protein n=1 Tax=Primorskyibacter sp. 2E107 TaxID=3403458 RepID=UPI003AF7C8F4